MSTQNRGFLTDDFLLHSDVARELYHETAAKMPIFDFHCHLPPREIAEDRQFANLTDIWLRGDHYKWRAMRTNGIDEERITGSADDREKFQAWAETLPRSLGNPLYHWSHLELARYFGIDDRVLGPDTAEEIWRHSEELLAQPAFSARGMLQQMDVRVVFTTDDPADSLEHHQALAEEAADPGRPAASERPAAFSDRRRAPLVRPTFRPDKALAVDSPEAFRSYLGRLGEAADLEITSYTELQEALRRRMDHFASLGCRVSDHALVAAVGAPDAESRAPKVFDTVRAGEEVSPGQIEAFRTALLLFLGREYARRGWVMQLHIGALRDTNSRMFYRLGPDAGFDSMADEPVARRLTRFLNMLDRDEALPKTILYNLNPRDNELMASTMGDFQDGTVPGKMQLGPAWWFNDWKEGMEGHMRSLAAMGLLSRFVGMTTDSRSFLSYTRHEYFRRLLCNLLGSWVARGEAPRDMRLLGGMVEDISWSNARSYFEMEDEIDAPGAPAGKGEA